MAHGATQLRLLLWKDYLLRKRKPVTIGGIVWATATLLSLVIVRKNIYAEPKPTCLYPARALPSAGLSPFLQSFICSVSNDCVNRTTYQGIPDYPNARLKQYQEQLQPLFENSSFMAIAESVPGAARLLTVLTTVIDQPLLHRIAREGLKVSDIFKDPEKAKTLLSSDLNSSKEPFDTIFASNINFENIVERISSGEKLSCDVETAKKFFRSTNESHIEFVARAICNTEDKKLQQILNYLLMEVDIRKYFKLIGDVLNKLSGNATVTNIGEMANAVLRMTSVENYIPQELQIHKWLQMSYSSHQSDFSYVSLDLVYRFLNILDSVFRESETFKSIRAFVEVSGNMLASMQKTLDKRITRPRQNNDHDNSTDEDNSVGNVIALLILPQKSQSSGRNLTESTRFLQKQLQLLETTVETLTDGFMSTVKPVDVIDSILSVVANLLPKQIKNRLFFHLTLINKMLIGAHSTVRSNLHMEQIMFECCKRNPEGVKIVQQLGPSIVSKIIDGLADGDRVQALTRKIKNPGQIFCDQYRIQTFLKISKDEATVIRPLVCNSQWRNFITDIIDSFGVYNSSKMINEMASMVVSDTLGKNIEDQFVEIKDVLKNVTEFYNFINDEQMLKNVQKLPTDWNSLIDNNNFTDIVNVLKSKAKTSNIILVTVHSALAREIIAENSILETYISPTLLQVTDVLTALSKQIDDIPQKLMADIQKHFVSLTELTLATLHDKEKTLSVLTADHNTVFCGLAERCANSTNCGNLLDTNDYIVFPSDADPIEMTQLLCQISTAVTNKLHSNLEDDKFIKLMYSFIDGTKPKSKESEVNWTLIIKTMQQLYNKMDSRFGFIFTLNSDIDEDVWSNARLLSDRLQQTWVFDGRPNNVLQLSVSLFSRLMDTLDKKLFSFDQFPMWSQMKIRTDAVDSLLYILNQFMKMLSAFMTRDEYFEVEGLPLSSKYFKDFGLNFVPLLRDIATSIATKPSNVPAILSVLNAKPSWPCSEESLGGVLDLKGPAATAFSALEELLCEKENLRSEWKNFQHINKLKLFTKNHTANVTLSERPFLNLAESFNEFVDSFEDIQSTVQMVYGNPPELETSQEFSLLAAWDDILNLIKADKDYAIIKQILQNIDVILNSTSTDEEKNDSSSPAKLWETAMACEKDGNSVCRHLYWPAVRYSVHYLAEAGQQIVSDLTEYFSEISEPGANVLQLMGFTRRTGPYIMYGKLPQLIGTLVNSFMDQGFMKQVRQSMGKKFWDCEKLMNSLALPTDGSVTESDIKLLIPYACPSILHWVSVPTNENVLLDLFSKSQYLFYNNPASTFTVRFEELFQKTLVLQDIMGNVSKSNNTNYPLWTEDWVNNFKNIGRSLTFFNLTSNETSKMDLINSAYVKSGLTEIYLAKVTLILNDIKTNLSIIDLKKVEMKTPTEQADFKMFLKLFDRRPGEMVEMFLFAITESLKSSEDYKKFSLISSLDIMCKNESYSDEEHMWLKTNARVISQLCKCNYRNYLIMSDANFETNNSNSEKLIVEYVEELVALEKTVSQSSEVHYNWKDILDNIIGLNGPTPGELIKRSTSYTRDLTLKLYLQYLDSRLKHHHLIMGFVTNEDWWKDLRELYNGEYASHLLQFVEKSPVIVDDIFNNIAQVKIMRLLKDMNLNDTSLLCGLEISEYIPDSTGLISGLKQSLCRLNESSLFTEIPSLGFADQVYADDIVIIEESNEASLLSHINNLNSRLAKFIKDGPQPAAVPKWISETDVATFQEFNARFAKDAVKVDLAFLIISNIIDASTLFLNTTYSSASSILTPWVKQINLQLIKTEEYATLMCELPMLNLTEIHSTLVENFHWDLALNEITSGRNYTSIELNKSLNELLNIVRHFVHDSFHGKLDKTMKCLLNETNGDSFTQASMYITLGSRVMKLIRSMSPHFNEISGFKKSPVIEEFFKEVSKAIPVMLPLEQLLINSTIFKRNIRSQFKNIHDDDIQAILRTKVDLNKMLLTNYSIAEYLKPNMSIQNGTNNLNPIIWKNIKKQFDAKNLDNLRSEAFWTFDWLSGTVLGVEKFLEHSGKLLLQLVPIDVNGVAAGRINSMIDFMLQLFQKNYLDQLVLSLNGIIGELHPLLNDSHIENDLMSLSKGLESLGSFKEDITSNFNMKIKLNEVFRDWDDLKMELQKRLNISSRLAEDIQNASLDIAPLLKSEDGTIHISEYICKPVLLKKLVHTSQQSLQNISETFCDLDDATAKNISLVFLQKINFSFVIDIVINTTMKQLMRASKLTEEEGEKIFKVLGEAASLVPALGPVFTNLSQIVENEPLIKSFQNASGISSLLNNPDFFVDSGKLMCGTPFYTNVNRFYKVIAATKDNNIEHDQKQLDSLPTDYCRNLYKEVVGMGGGKILWSYAKPFLMGKILYTPDTPRIRQIIKEANSSFSQIGQLTSLLKGFSEGFESLDEIILHKESLTTMQKLMQSTFIRNALLKFAPSNSDNDTAANVDMTEINLDEIISQFTDSKDLGRLISRISQMTDCIGLDRFTPAQNELSLETRAASLMKTNEFMAGIVFLDTNERSVNSKLPTSIKYKIRMDIDNIPSSSRIKNRFWTPDPEAEFIDNLRYFRGFVQLQDLIDKAIISTSATDRLTKRSIQNESLTDLSSEFDTENSWGIYTQQIPYPCWTRDDFQTIMYESQALIVAFFFCLILTVSSIVRSMVWERESGNTDLMCVMGMRRRWHTLSWFMASAIEVFFTMGALCFVLKVGGILPNTNPGLLYLMLLNFGFSIVMFCYLVSSLFRSASLGAVSAAILYLLSFMPYVIVIAMEAGLSLPQKLFTSLSMSTGFCYGILFAARYEVQGSGLNFQNFWSAPDVNDSMSVALSTFMVLFDSILYGLIAWIINSMCFRDSVATGEIKTEETSSGEVGNSDLIGVRITNLTKQYGNRRALDEVSLDLKRGHITTLLGHNGAGKTTLIKIITGMIKQDSGKITINDHKEDEKGTAEWEKVKNHIGLCPQFDVLLEDMTAREHLVYYAQLKTGNTFDQVKYEVDSMSDAMGLGSLADEPVRRLSGGLRRRLAVGLAFIARPHVVVLDEPSSGVDPVARRGIWSLIVGLKAHRTVLLTTHHLDEAELLSDTVVIMHKGKVRACGSPLGLKHQYGDGYKITLTYQPLFRNPAILHKIKEVNGSTDNFIGRDTLDKAITKDSHLDMKIKTKCLMACVNEFVKNPSIPEIKNNDIQVNLPFLDANGSSNDFLSVTNLLENKKSELEYSAMGVDCSNLEQVFLSICGEADGETPPQQNGHATSWIQNSIDNDLIERCDPDVPDNLSSEKCASDASIVSADVAWRGSNFNQLVALLRKRLLHYSRSWWLLSAVILLPAIFVTVAMAFSLIRPPPDSELPLSLNSQLYSSHSAEFIGYSQNSSERNGQPGVSVMEKLLEMSKSQGKMLQFWTQNERSCKCTHGKQRCLKLHSVNSSSQVEVKDRLIALPSVQDTVKWLISSQDQYIEKRYGGWSALDSSTENKQATDFIVWYNNKGHHSLPAYLNALNNAILRKRLGHNNINITTYNHPLKLSTEQLSKSSLLQHVADVGISVVLVIGFSLVAAGAAVYLVKERTEQEKRLQLLCGVRPLTYWLASLIWDVLIIVIAIILSACILEIFGLPVYVSRDNLPAICVLLLLYGFSSSSLVHLLEKLFNEGSLANMIIFCCNVFVAAAGLTILLIIDVLATSDVMGTVRKVLQKIFMVWPQFALGDALVEMSKNTIQADILQRFGMDTYEAPLGFNVAGHHCVALVVTAVLFFLINLAVEAKVFHKLFNQQSKEGTIEEPEDCDVATERYRVELSTMKAHYNIAHIPVEAQSHPSKVNGGERIQDYVAKLPENDVMQTLALRKEYNAVLGTRVAVHNLTFGVRSGQCLGLLGVNGAGKSTTFKMLTGELRPTAGHIFLSGKRVSQQELCDGSIAYCPQNDALDPLLTLTEHLQFYCKLRGIKNPKKNINRSLEEFELERYAGQRAATLSGGNKRKLCTAIALLGHAPLVLLDEPTSGMDPVSRGRTGVVLRRATDAGRALLLSTHSLSDCEALCHVAALTSHGRFQAMGPPHHLKRRFGGGYLVSIRLENPSQRSELLTVVTEAFPGSELQTFHYCTAQFLIHQAASTIFAGLATVTAKLNIIDYSINQSSLDQVFVNFSHSQAEANNTRLHGDLSSIKLSTLERQYSQPKIYPRILTQESSPSANTVTKL